MLLAAAQNGDADAASFLCGLYGNSTGSDASEAEVIDPDLRGAAYQAALGRLGACLSPSGMGCALMLHVSDSLS